MRLAFRDELLATVGVFAGLVIVVPLSATGFAPFVLLRLFLSMIALLLIPGYFWQAALFPENASLTWWGRAALCVGISAASVPFLTLLLDGLLYVPMHFTGIAAGVLVWSLIGAALAWWRRRRLEQADRFMLAIPVEQIRPVAAQDRLGTFLVALLLVAVAATGVALAVTYSVAGPARQFTEFSVLGPGDSAENYPRTLQVDTPTAIRLTVSNHEASAQRYFITARIGEQTVGASSAFDLADGASTGITLAITPTTTANDQPVDVILWREGFVGPYRTLRLWVDITSGAHAQDSG